MINLPARQRQPFMEHWGDPLRTGNVALNTLIHRENEIPGFNSDNIDHLTQAALRIGMLIEEMKKEPVTHFIRMFEERILNGTF